MKLTKEQKQEIVDQQAQENVTKRVTSAEPEKILYDAIPVLDHGYVRGVLLPGALNFVSLNVNIK